ncbi:hypothetical protein I010_11268, partial [Pasteurella multocida 1500C]
MTHAFLPAVISYIALVYIVHLEACKMNLQGLPRTDEPKPFLNTLLRALGTFIFLCVLYFAVEFGLGWLKVVTPHYAFSIVIALLAV